MVKKRVDWGQQALEPIEYEEGVEK